ncbi:MAG TPA: hypothetical protein VNV44_11760 [Solirubrobacteraceae bacterium]|jgi:hypothetical protein|nr:hypothetical protein [Solirubrobacteraceae bacterium]
MALAGEELHRGLRTLVRVLPEHELDLVAALGQLLGDPRAIAHHGIDPGILDVFSAKVKRGVRARVAALSPAREAAAERRDGAA